MAVERFRDDYFFLSSMYPLHKKLWTPQGIMVPTSEHPYHAAKYIRQSDQLAVLEAKNGFEAQKTSKRFKQEDRPMREDWDEVKIAVMGVCVAVKFATNPSLAKKLKATGEEELFEGNDRGQTFWGVSPIGSRNGENWLGKILMDTRAMLNSGELAELDVEEAMRGIFTPAIPPIAVASA